MTHKHNNNNVLRLNISVLEVNGTSFVNIAVPRVKTCTVALSSSCMPWLTRVTFTDSSGIFLGYIGHLSIIQDRLVSRVWFIAVIMLKWHCTYKTWTCSHWYLVVKSLERNSKLCTYFIVLYNFQVDVRWANNQVSWQVHYKNNITEIFPSLCRLSYIRGACLTSATDTRLWRFNM